MREALAHAQEFSLWLNDEFPAGSELPEDSDRDDLLEVWLAQRASDAFHDAEGIQPRNWQFFQDLCGVGGRAGSSEHQSFDFSKQQQMTAAVTQLQNANLMVRETDPEDGTRTINSVTSLGWLVYFHRSDFHIPTQHSRPKKR
ncbi:hypothetical protein ACQBAR_04115 [Propionibacteriaceae bacterium Y1685]